MKRILIVTRSIPKHADAGGMERATIDVAKRLSTDNEITILTTPVPGRPPQWTEGAIHYVTIPNVDPGRYSIRWWVKTALFSPLRDFDRVVSASAGAVAMIHFRRGIHYTFIAHGTSKRELRNVLITRPRRWPLRALRNAYWSLLDWATFARVARVEAVSERVASMLRERPYTRVWKHTELVVVPNHVDDDFYAPDPENRARKRAEWGFDSSDLVVATVSRLDRQKGVDQAISAVAECDEHIHLLVAGDGDERDSLEQLATELGLRERVHFLGRLEQASTRDVYHLADVFVLPVRNFAREGMPLTVLEALAAGLRVIVPEESTWPADVAPRVQHADVVDARSLALSIISDNTTSVGSAGD